MGRNRKQRGEYREYPKSYYHLSSDGWKEGLLFHTVQEFAYGMTLIGLIALKYHLIILDFSLMPNHVHILLYGDGKDCTDAFIYFKNKLSERLKKDSYTTIPDDYWFKLTPVSNPQQLKINYLYIDRNHFEKNISVPGTYPWGAAYLFHSLLSKHINGTPAKDMSKRELERLTGSRIEIPGDWEFHPTLGLLPKCFVRLSKFYELFPTAKDYGTRIIKDYEAFIKMSLLLEEQIDLSKEEINDIVNQILAKQFPNQRIEDLPNPDKARICVLLHKTYMLTITQISYAVKVPEYLVKQFLNSKDYGR